MYDPTALDDEEYDQMDIGARREAEKVMGRRDREEALTSGRLRRGLLYGTIQFVHFFQNGRQAQHIKPVLLSRPDNFLCGRKPKENR